MFMWADESSGGQLFGANSNFGLVHLSDDPYQVLADAFADINALAGRWHETGPAPPPSTNAPGAAAGAASSWPPASRAGGVRAWKIVGGSVVY